MCRQFIREFCSLDMPVLLVPGDYLSDAELVAGKEKAKIKVMTVGELLPESFGPEHLPQVKN